MEFSQTRRGNVVVLYKGFEYIKSRVNEDGLTTWKCRAKFGTRCRAKLKTKEGEVIGECQQHCHESNIQKAKANILKAKMKEEMKEVGATPKKVMENILLDVNEHVLHHLPKQSSLERSLRKNRPLHHKRIKKVIPDEEMDTSTISDLPNPDTIDFPIPEKYANLILYDTGANDPERILAIGDSEMLLELNKDAIYGDGTFDKSPSLFHQLFTWYAKVGNCYPPCIYFLLPQKNLDTYGRMFAILQQLLPTMSPHEILLDFEDPCMTAAQLAFPQAEVKGCYFHLCQNLIKKITNVGLKEVFDVDIDIKLKLKSLTSLTFVPMTDVKNIFNELAATFPEDFCYSEVLTYFFTTFIEGVAGRPARFPIVSWNHFEAADDGCPKTSNLFERFHNALRSLLHFDDSSIWTIFDGLRRDIAGQRRLQARALLAEPNAQKKRRSVLAAKVSAAVNRYESEPDKLEFLCEMANIQ